MLRALLRHFRADRRANVTPIFAFSLVPMLAFVGSAVDYGRGNSIKSAMQAAADATALNLVQNAASIPSGDVSATATNIFNSVFSRPDANNLTISASSTSGGTVTVSATASTTTDFMGVVGLSSITIRSSAVAIKTPGDGLGCVLALNRNASGVITAQGSTVVNLSGCSMYDNSSHASAMTVGGSASITALSIGVVGGISGNVTTTQGVRTGLSPLPDPYAKVAVPFYSGCNETNFSAKSQVTINPGVYCGGMQFNANADVTFNPGVYIVDRGDFQVNGGAILQGTGVTIVFTSSTMSNWPTASINGGATVSLTPPSTGPLAGLVMFGDRNIPTGTSFKFNGGASQYLGGAIYFPTGEIDFAGGAGANTTCTQLIGDTIKFTGNSGLAINCAGYGTKPISPTGVRLVS